MPEDMIETARSTSHAADKTYVHVGCGTSAAAGWLNFDANPRVRLPIWRGGYPRDIRYANITKLPLRDNSVDLLFASHVLEHLPREDLDTALSEVYRVLKPGGRFRLIVPDLRERARRYLASSNPETASDEFMRSTGLGVVSKPRGLFAKMKQSHGHSRHLWMWDYSSMSAALRKHGFRESRSCTFGDSNDLMLAAVERKDRYINRFGITEVGIEAIK
jgi:predicted SAM-dependent methyltransferase